MNSKSIYAVVGGFALLVGAVGLGWHGFTSGNPNPVPTLTELGVAVVAFGVGLFLISRGVRGFDQTRVEKPLHLIGSLVISIGVAVILLGLFAFCLVAVQAPNNQGAHDRTLHVIYVGFSFAGVDLDNNGLLIQFPGSGPPGVNVLELSSWSMHFSGNSHSPAFDLGLSDVFGFIYEINSAGIGDGPAFDPITGQNLTEGIGAVGATHFYTTGLGPNQIVGGYIGGAINFPGNFNFAANAQDSSTHLALVTPVPEPATPLLALAALVPALRRRK